MHERGLVFSWNTWNEHFLAGKDNKLFISWLFLLISASDMELCCICFDQVCTIEVRPCGHQMCAHCTLALCCHEKPDPDTACPSGPVCPFCRGAILQLVVAKIDKGSDTEVESSSPMKPRRSRKSNFSEGSSSFKGLSAMGSFGRIASRNSGKITAEKQ